MPEDISAAVIDSASPQPAPAPSSAAARAARSGGPGRVVLFTGAAGILGTAFLHAAGNRFHIAAVYRGRQPRGVATQYQRYIDPLRPRAQLPINRKPVFAVRADLEVPGEIGRVVELVMARYGRIDIVVNAAAHPVLGSAVVADQVLATATRQFHVNAIVPLQLGVAVARRFWRDRVIENRARNRCVINLASTAGLRVYPRQGHAVYGPSKAALIALSEQMAHEFGAFGVRVNALAPTTFPAIIPTETVVDGIIRLADGRMTGKTLVQDRGVNELI